MTGGPGRAGRHAIRAWSVVSPYGIGARPFADAVAAGRPPQPTRLDPALGELPDGAAFLVPGFEISEVLGRKGTRSMDGVSALAVTAVRELLGSCERRGAAAAATDTGLVLGTTTGSAKSMMDITRDTLIHQKPFYIDAARIPNAIMNSAAAQCAIWHQLKGPNATVAGGRAAGLSALRYALRLLDSQRAGAVLCGGVEEYTPARAWLEYHGRAAAEPSVPLGEGAGVLLLEPAGVGHEPGAGGPALAEVLCVELGVYRGRDPAPELTACLRRALQSACVLADDVWAVSAVPGEGQLGRAELSAVDLMFGDRTRRVPGGQPWGDAGAVTVPFQIAALLATAERRPEAGGRVAAVTAVDRDGVLGCCLLRLGRP